MGNINWDVSIFEDSFAGLGEEVAVRDVEEFSGGKGANVAVAAARLLGRGRAAIVGAVGSDDVGRRQIRELRKEGVVTSGIVTIDGSRSGRAYILVNREGKKSIHSHRGANALIRPSHLEMAGPTKVLSQTSVLVVMDTPMDVAIAAVRKSRSSGARIIYSPGTRAREKGEALTELIRTAEFLVLDRSELRRLSGESDVVRASMALRRGSPSLTVIATSGKGGCVVASDSGAARLGGVELSSLGMKAVNSTGSGDAFLGVLVGYLSTGSSAVEAARWANLAGALKAARYETRGSPTRTELEKTMKRVKGR